MSFWESPLNLAFAGRQFARHAWVLEQIERHHLYTFVRNSLQPFCPSRSFSCGQHLPGKTILPIAFRNVHQCVGPKWVTGAQELEKLAPNLVKRHE
jgi:hypothetical protein